MSASVDSGALLTHDTMQGWFSTDLHERVGALVANARVTYWTVALAVWQLAIVFYVVGDTALTTVVLELGGYEANPVSQAFVGTLGYFGLVVQKALVLGILVLLWRYYPAVGVESPDPWRLIVPAIPLLRGVQLVAIHLSNVPVLL